MSHNRQSFHDRLYRAAAVHIQNGLVLLRQCSIWILCLPALVIALTAVHSQHEWGWFHEKGTQEIIAPSILALAFFVSLLYWARAGDFYSRWLVLLTGALFCRELHFWGTNNGIYLIMLLLLWYASRHFAAMQPLTQNRLPVSLFVAALVTYGISKTFDRAYWSFVGGWRDWQDTMEESLESTAHLLVLSLAAVSYFSWGRLWRRQLVQPTPLARRGAVWATMATACVVAFATFYSWYGEDDKPLRRRSHRGFSVEMSSVCNVSPALGPNLFLASSDEEHTLTLWSCGADMNPTVLQRLDLTVDAADGNKLHLDDLEEIAWDGLNTYYAIGSHRHLLPEEDAARRKKSRGTECALVRFQLSRAEVGVAITDTQIVTQDLLPKIRALNVFPSIDWRKSKVFSWRGLVKTWQLDIEGLACVGDQLLLGFKNPIEDGKATILSYDPATDRLSVAARPDLEGDGILGMHYEPVTDRLFVLSNNPIKHRFGDSCIWIGTRNDSTESWQFPPEQRFVVEYASAKARRKASGITIRDGKAAICFDSETEAPIEIIALDAIQPRY